MRLRIYFSIFIIASFFSSQSANADDHIKSVLILHSYSTDYQWTNDANNAILDAFHEDAPKLHLRTEFMDTKNYNHPQFMKSLAELYKHKYANAQPDGIIAMDNNALNFIETYGKDIFPNAVAVAAGINNAKPPSEDAFTKTIISEDPDHTGTILQAVKFWPKIKNVFVISDTTPTGLAILGEVKAAASRIPNINIIVAPNLDAAGLENFASSRKETDLIYILPFFKSIDGSTFKQGEMEKKLATVATVPIIASWSYQLNTGIIGGRVISSKEQGKIAVKTLLKRLNHKKEKRLYVLTSAHLDIYDYAALKRFDADFSKLPDDTIFINKPVNFWENHRAILLPASLIIAALSIFTLLLINNLQKQRKIISRDKRLLALDEEVINTQRELVTTLGEVIEVRSQETGNHVKRVAKVSRMLGGLCGLTEPELNLLEAAAPLHDVGKIGIPESILHKPGKLTVDEFEIMKTHTGIGNEILSGSNRELLKIACEIAYQHHERWDGSGYPNGLKGDDISLFARITTLADVYDALSSDRNYKEAWPEKRTLDYIISERGKLFDPQLVDMFIENIATARSIRAQHPNNTDTANHHHSAPRQDTSYII